MHLMDYDDFNIYKFNESLKGDVRKLATTKIADGFSEKEIIDMITEKFGIVESEINEILNEDFEI